MNITLTIYTTLALAISTTLMACGGGSSSTTGITANPVTTTGIITKFGSVFVNGIRFQTTKSRIISADNGSVVLQNPSNAQLQSILGLGQVIHVEGRTSDSSNGVANTIFFDNELRGPISSISSANGSLQILGQTVSLNPDTIIDDSIIEVLRGVELPADIRFGNLPESLDQLFSVGMVVEISGIPTDNGFEATRIEDVNNRVVGGGVNNVDNNRAEVKGIITNLTSGQFQINGLTVLFDSGDLDNEDFSNQPISNGQFVEVHGTATSSSIIEATRIELEKRFVDNNFLNNQGSIRIRDVAVSSNGTSFTTRLGLTVTPTNRSRLEDDTRNNKKISISRLLGNVTGKSIEARGFSLNGNTVWTRIEIEKDNDLQCRLRGPVTSINGNNFTIEGIAINTGQVANNNFEDANDQSIGRSAFFNNLRMGDIIQATSNKSGNGCVAGQLTAREVEFEPNLFFNNNGGNNGNNFNDNEIKGNIGSVSANSFVVAGQTINVNANTIIDDSLIEAARGVEIDNDQAFGSLPESLSALLPIGLNVEVQLNRSNGLVAISIEDI